MANSPSFVSRFVDHPVIRVIFPPPLPGKSACRSGHRDECNYSENFDYKEICS